MGHDPQWLRKTGRILSSLLQASDDEMADFVRERLNGADVDPARAADARAILIHLGEALQEPTKKRLMSVEHTRRVLEDWQTGDKQDATTSASAPPPASPPSAPPAPVMPSGPAPVIRIPSVDPRAPSPWAGAEPPRPVQTPAHASSPDGLGTTTAGHPAPAVNALPFAPGQAAPKKLSLEPHAAMGQTAPLAPKPKKKTMPFAQIPEASSTLTIEQYAYFCAERALWPAHQAQTCGKYGVDPAQEDELHEHFRKTLTGDAAQQARFNELRAQALAQLSG